jgi:hypothetical protein
MKQSDPLQLVEEGSLTRPGPVGRIVRLALGMLCLYAIYELLLYHEAIINTPISVIPNISLLVFVAILIINHVVNIGFGKSWGRIPSYLSIAAMLIFAGVSWLTFGTLDHALLGAVLWGWLFYFYAHLGLSFVLSAIIATPGCEMRSIPELLGRLSARAVQEHHCPASFITKIDDWEKKAVAGRH